MDEVVVGILINSFVDLI